MGVVECMGKENGGFGCSRSGAGARAGGVATTVCSQVRPGVNIDHVSAVAGTVGDALAKLEGTAKRHKPEMECALSIVNLCGAPGLVS